MKVEGNYGNTLHITKAQAAIGSHAGDCADDIKWLANYPSIHRQLNQLNPDTLRQELEEYGAWDASDLANHEANCLRWLWIACGEITERENR